MFQRQVRQLRIRAMKGVSSSDISNLLKIMAVVAIKLQKKQVKDLKSSIITPSVLDSANRITKTLGVNREFTKLVNNLLKKSTDVAPLAFTFSKQFDAKMKTPAGRQGLLESMDIHQNQEELLKPLLVLLRNPDSKGSYTLVQKRITTLKDPKLNHNFLAVNVEKLGTLDNLDNQIRTKVKQLTGNQGDVLTTQEKQKLRSNPRKAEILKEYNRLKQEHGQRYNTESRQVVADSGKEHIPVRDFVKGMTEKGITKLHVHPAFHKTARVHINYDNALTDPEGRTLSAQPGFHHYPVEINPNYKYNPAKKGNNWLFKYRNIDNPDSKWVGAIPKEFSSGRRSTKFGKVDEFLNQPDALEKLKKRWRSFFNHGRNDDDPERVYSYLSEYQYWTSSRIGTTNEGLTGGNPTYGASNFRVRHIKKKGDNNVEIYYDMKGNEHGDFNINSNVPDASDDDRQALTKLVSFIKRKTSNKSGKDIVFDVNGSRISDKKYNDWLTKTCRSPVPAHSLFRTIRGTELARDTLAKATSRVKALQKTSNKPLSQKSVDEQFMAAMEEVGKKLGHIRRLKNEAGETITKNTATTAIKAYVSPSLMGDWYSELGYPPNSYVKAALRSSKANVEPLTTQVSDDNDDDDDGGGPSKPTPPSGGSKKKAHETKKPPMQLGPKLVWRRNLVNNPKSEKPEEWWDELNEDQQRQYQKDHPGGEYAKLPIHHKKTGTEGSSVDDDTEEDIDPRILQTRVVPAIKNKSSGKIYKGKPGDLHMDIVKRHHLVNPRDSRIANPAWYDRGFHDPVTKKYYSGEDMPFDSTELHGYRYKMPKFRKPRTTKASAMTNNSGYLHLTATDETGSRPSFRTKARDFGEVQKHLDKLHSYIKEHNLPPHNVSIENKNTGEVHSAKVGPRGIYQKSFSNLAKPKKRKTTAQSDMEMLVHKMHQRHQQMYGGLSEQSKNFLRNHQHEVSSPLRTHLAKHFRGLQKHYHELGSKADEALHNARTNIKEADPTDIAKDAAHETWHDVRELPHKHIMHAVHALHAIKKNGWHNSSLHNKVALLGGLGGIAGIGAPLYDGAEHIGHAIEATGGNLPLAIAGGLAAAGTGFLIHHGVESVGKGLGKTALKFFKKKPVKPQHEQNIEAYLTKAGFNRVKKNYYHILSELAGMIAEFLEKENMPPEKWIEALSEAEKMIKHSNKMYPPQKQH